jgi:hypothetical protein
MEIQFRGVCVFSRRFDLAVFFFYFRHGEFNALVCAGELIIYQSTF